MRKHKQKETPKQIHTCTSCPYETPYKHNLNKHIKTHDKERANGACKFCPECGKSFPVQRNLTKHLKIHQKKTSPSAPQQVEKVKTNIGFGTFLREEKKAFNKEILCAQCTQEDYLNEIIRQRCLASGTMIDETLIETIMVQ